MVCMEVKLWSIVIVRVVVHAVLESVFALLLKSLALTFGLFASSLVLAVAPELWLLREGLSVSMHVDFTLVVLVSVVRWLNDMSRLNNVSRLDYMGWVNDYCWLNEVARLVLMTPLVVVKHIVLTRLEMGILVAFMVMLGVLFKV